MCSPFEHLNVRPAVMEYAGTILNSYFSDECASVKPVPCYEAAVAYVGRQFKALQLEGVIINEERMNA